MVVLSMPKPVPHDIYSLAFCNRSPFQAWPHVANDFYLPYSQAEAIILNITDCFSKVCCLVPLPSYSQPLRLQRSCSEKSSGSMDFLTT